MPVYRRLAAEAVEIRARGVSMKAIAEHFGVDDHTVAKAVRWFHGETRSANQQRFIGGSH